MKKLLSIFLILAMLLGLTGCGDLRVEVNINSSTAPENWPPLDAMETSGVTEQTQSDDESYPTQPEDLLPPQTDYTGPAETSPSEPTTPNTPTDPEDSRPREDEEDRPVDTQPQESQPQEELPEQTDPQPTEPTPTTPSNGLDPNGVYDSKDMVALYIVTYGKLPKNYITKSQADRLGWGGNTGYTIGGDRFYNREGLLPTGYTYYECDIGTLGGSRRGAKRLVYTKSGIVYYTSDHYESFTLLYGNP